MSWAAASGGVVTCLLSIVAATLGCTSPSEPNTVDATPEPAPEPVPVDPKAAAEQAEAQAWLARYQRGEVSMKSDDPRVEYVATGRDPCESMPATRPPGFELSYWADPYDGIVELFHGIAGAECHFEWDMLWVEKPAGACVVLDDARLDALYAELRALEIWRIEFEPMQPTPHSVGHGLLVRWPGSRCELLDIHGVSEVVERDAASFRAALDLFRTAYNAGR